MSAPRNPGLLGPNRGTRGTKVAFVRLSNEARSTSTDYVELISGAGAPSGGYGRTPAPPWPTSGPTPPTPPRPST